MKPKKMKYQANRKIELLYSDTYQNYKYYILNLGTHPTAYVEIPKGHKLYYKNYNDIDNILVHGGLTYSDDHLCIAKDNALQGWFIGWDYAHCYDYEGYYDEDDFLNENTKKWTTEEIINECHLVINQIIEYYDKISIDDIISEINRVQRVEKEKQNENII